MSGGLCRHDVQGSRSSPPINTSRSMGGSGILEGGSVQDRSKKRLPSPIDIEVGRRIRLQRHILGISQSALAEGLDVTFQQVQKYERGTNRVGASRLQRVAECLGVPIAHFFDDLTTKGLASTDDVIRVGNDLVRFLSSEEGVELNRAFANIKDAKTRQKIVSLVKSIATD